MNDGTFSPHGASYNQGENQDEKRCCVMRDLDRVIGYEEIKNELARLIGGAELTDKVYESAEEMKKLADERKKEVRA